MTLFSSDSFSHPPAQGLHLRGFAPRAPQVRRQENEVSYATSEMPLRVKDSQGQGGYMLPLVIVLLVMAAFLVIPLLGQLSTALLKGGEEREQRMKLYAAEAAINRVVADLIRGADGVGTTYTTTSPHRAGQSYDTFIITTSYTAPSVTVNDYTPAVTISLASPTQAIPSTQQNYVDPGVTHPQLATLAAGKAYLVRLYNVKAGTIQVNWAYSPASISRIGVWAGLPLDPRTNPKVPYLPGEIDRWPIDQPILDTGFTPANVSFNRTNPVVVDPATDDSGGVYTIVLDNSRGTATKTTAAFAPSGGPGDTWIYVKAYKDYVITASVGDVSVATYVRQVPGFAEPPVWTSAWATNNVSFITNEVYAYTWLSP